MARTPEAAVKDAVKAWLKARGWWWFMPVSNGMGVVGLPDFICIRPVVVTPEMVGITLGMFVGIETKAPGKLNNLTPNQRNRLAEIAAHGGGAHVVSDTDALDDIYG